jgi:hypothetical protein
MTLVPFDRSGSLPCGYQINGSYFLPQTDLKVFERIVIEEQGFVICLLFRHCRVAIPVAIAASKVKRVFYAK